MKKLKTNVIEKIVAYIEKENIFKATSREVI